MNYEDYPESIELHITQKIIDLSMEAQRSNHFRVLVDCVASRAGQAVFPLEKSVVAAGDYLCVNHLAYYRSPELQEVIRTFDARCELKPCTLVLPKTNKRDTD